VASVTYGSVSTGSQLELLFFKHTYLACIARLLLWASFSRGKVSGTLEEVAADVLSGEFFRAHQLANLVEEDFFQWVRRPEAAEILAPVWERILAQMLTYDLAHMGEDVLKGVYQELVDPTDRHDLGEYYTPDWLCDRIVSRLLPEGGYVSVLDPACGSGSFLRAAIAHCSTQMSMAPRVSVFNPSGSRHRN
jgi:type I restriction-modification system DNA methylase subunit